MAARQSQSSFATSAQGITSHVVYDAWTPSNKKQTHAVQTKINSKSSTPTPTYGSYYRDITNPRTKKTIREHKIAWSRSESLDYQVAGYNRLKSKTLTQLGGLESKRGFHSSNLKLTKYNIPNAVSKRGGILGKSLGVIAMVGVNMLKKSAMGINKGARMLVDYTATKGVLGAGRLGLMRSSNMYKPPIGLVQGLSRTRHGR
jgi:hypothetical protein